MGIDLSEFETRIRVRQLRHDDYEEWRGLLKKCFPTLKPWLPAQMKSMIDQFPEGQVCIEVDGVMVASSSALVVQYDDYTDWHDYLEISGNG